jgi:hypothetical protein
MDTQLIAAIVGGFIGILGSVAILIASHFLRVSGKIIVNVTDSEVHFFLRDLEGGDREIDYIDDAQVLNVRFGIDIYNSSDIPRSLREIQVELRTRNRKKTLISDAEVFKSVISNTSPFASGFTKLDIMNLPSKELQHLNFRCLYKKPKINGVKGSVDFYLKALYPNGRRFKAHLLTTQIK